MVWTILYIVATYLLGSVAFGYLAGKCKGIDLREHGSCNIGATNAWRVLGWKMGLPVFIMDFLKGFVPVYGAMHWLPLLTGIDAGWGHATAVVLTCFATVLGHTYTCFLGFKGGKGVATTGGVLFALSWQVGCVALGGWLLFFLVTGIVSLASLVAALAMIGSGWYFFKLTENGALSSDILYIIFFSLIGLLVIIKHRSNIGRLLSGTEHSFYSKKKKENSK